MKKSIFKRVSLCGLIGGTFLLSACGTPGTVKVSKSFGFLEGQPITDVVAFYGIPDHKDKIAGKDAFVYEFHKDYLKNSIVKGNHRVNHKSCKITFTVDEKLIVTHGDVIGTDEECNMIYTHNKTR